MGRPKTYTEEDLSDFRRLILTGLSTQDAADQVGREAGVLRLALKREHGLSISSLRSQAIQAKSSMDDAEPEIPKSRSLRLPTTSTRTGRPKRDYTRECPICSQTFVTKKNRQKYCSLSCTAMAPKKTPKERETLVKICDACRKVFETKRAEQRYCSNECRIKRISSDKKRLSPAACPVCKKVFQPRAKTNKFCSRSCAMYGRRNPKVANGYLVLDSGNRVRYESSYELVFLLYCKENPHLYRKVSRCDFTIPYSHGGSKHLYYPDFAAHSESGKPILIEVKSQAVMKYEPSKSESKIAAARTWCNGNGYDFEFLIEDNPDFVQMCDYVSKEFGLDAIHHESSQWRDELALKSCLNCGETIPIGRRSLKAYLALKFCSLVCSRGYRHRATLRSCPNCGKEFSAYGEKIHCSKSCYTESQQTLVIIPCPICDKPFKPSSRSQRTCGKECGIAYRVRTRINTGDFREPGERFLVCQQCGKEFVSKSKTRKYCTPECYHDARRTHEISQCANCGTDFYNYTGRLTFCSRACAGRKKRLTEAAESHCQRHGRGDGENCSVNCLD